MNLKLVFYLEIFINIITILLCFFAPAKFIDQLVTTEHSTFAYELARWYGVVLLIFSGIFLLALLHESFELLKIVLQVNLVGDWVQILAAIHTAMVFSQWTFGLIFTIVICFILFVFRVIVLRKPALAGYRLA